MKPLDQAVETVIRVLGIDDEDVARRKAFLEFTDADAERLRSLHEVLQTLEPDFVEDFYTHLLAFKETRHFIPDSYSLDHLKRTQTAYFSSLTEGRYDQRYIHNRLRVGIAHQRIGLLPEWYIGAYSNYLCGLIPEIWKQLGNTHQAFIPTCLSLIKIVLLDMSLAIDTYIEADRQTIRSLKEYAEVVFTSIPDGLLVLSSKLAVLSANQAFLERFGFTSDSVQNRYLMDILTADGLRGRLLEVLATGVAQHNLSFMMGPVHSGERKPVRVTLTGIRLAEEEEEEARLLLIVEDVTEEEKLRAAAVESERRFRDLAETAHDGIIMTGLDGNIAYFNRAAERMFGYRHRSQIAFSRHFGSHGFVRALDNADTQLSRLIGKTRIKLEMNGLHVDFLPHHAGDCAIDQGHLHLLERADAIAALRPGSLDYRIVPLDRQSEPSGNFRRTHLECGISNQNKPLVHIELLSCNAQSGFDITVIQFLHTETRSHVAQHLFPSALVVNAIPVDLVRQARQNRTSLTVRRAFKRRFWRLFGFLEQCGNRGVTVFQGFFLQEVQPLSRLRQRPIKISRSLDAPDFM